MMERMLFAVLVAALQTAQPSPAPTASPSIAPSPSAAPSPPVAPGFSVHGTGANAFVDQATSGAGATPPEGPEFAAGLPNAPMSPYDWFSGAPEVPGVAGEMQYEFNVAYRAPHATATATFMLSGTGGDITNSIYWGEPLLGPLAHVLDLCGIEIAELVWKLHPDE